MRDVNLDHVSEQYFDVLKEIGNIGAGNAMTALSQMLQCKVDMKVPQVRLLEFSEVGALMGGEEQIMAAVLLGVEGDITGYMMFMAEEVGAKHLIGKLTGGMLPEGSEFGEMGLSALQEVGNIITGAYLNSLSSMTGLRIVPSPPAVAIDMAGAILSVPAIQFGIYGDKILLIQSQFYDDLQLDGYFILIPDLESFGKMLTALGMPTMM